MTTPTIEVLDPSSEPAREPDRLHAKPDAPVLRPMSHGVTFAGIGVTAFGLLLIAVAWGGVAGEADVSRQIPYLVSGGIFGLALVLIGLTTLNIASKRRETSLRAEQTQLLAKAIDQLGRARSDDERYQS